MKKILCSVLMILSISQVNAGVDGRAKAICYDARGKEDHNIQVNSAHQSHFINNTEKVQTITVTYKLCAQWLPCKELKSTIPVSAHSEWHHEQRLGIMVSYHPHGKYLSRAETIITGAINRKEISEAKITVVD
jgi:hypothetical protein